MGNLVCENIVKKYKDKTVLDGVNLTIEPGKIYGLIGRNGVGKTTLLSIMTGQNPANSGSVTYDGMPVWENREALDHLCFSRELNTVGVLGPNKTKIKEYFKTASFFYPNWDQAMADRLVEKFGLNVKKGAHKLSKGMLSMVTIIIGLASKADITILDEPVAGLDVVVREEFYKLLLEEQMETGRTFIISTHIIEEAADVFEEVIMMRDNNILLKENTVNLLDRCIYATGAAEDIDSFTIGKNVVHTETMGRSKAVTIMLEEGQNFVSTGRVTVQPVSLQNLFVALCGGNGGME
jgi:ABC-2 type transport system ATP-binding protein